MSDLPELERLQALSLDPGDVLVVTVRHSVSMAEVDQIKATVNEALPGHVVLVTSGDVDLSAYRPVTTAEAES